MEGLSALIDSERAIESNTPDEFKSELREVRAKLVSVQREQV